MGGVVFLECRTIGGSHRVGRGAFNVEPGYGYKVIINEMPTELGEAR